MTEVPYRWETTIWVGDSLSQAVLLNAATADELITLATEWLLSHRPNAFGNASLAVPWPRRIHYFQDVNSKETLDNAWYCVDQLRTGQAPRPIGKIEDAIHDFVRRAIVIGREIDHELYETLRNQEEEQRRLQEQERRLQEQVVKQKRVAEEEEAARKAAQQLEKVRRKYKIKRTMKLAAERHRIAASELERQKFVKREAFLQKVAQVKADREARKRQAAIKRFVEDRGIREIVHFTREENLSSILEFGLLCRSTLEKQNFQVRFNDQSRLDGNKDSICLSISFPNFKLFFRWSHANRNNWVVLSITPKVLWEKECLFCHTNAASNDVRRIRGDERRKPEALYGLYEDYCGSHKQIRRDMLNLTNDMPTNPQAEVLVLQAIDPANILKIHFFDKQTAITWRDEHPMPNLPSIAYGGRFFSPRSDHAHWRDSESFS